MSADPSTFVGRSAELEALEAALSAAHDGTGSLWLVSGEPGIGKSRLCEELARRAAARGVSVAFGRCWEAGGAPAYWPWLQALRQLLRERSHLQDAVLAAAPELVQVLPELALGRADAAPPSLEPEQARFQLLHALSCALQALSRPAPALFVLEDLHAADSSSISLLEFVAHQAATTRALIVGTLRDADALWSAVGPPLLRVQRQVKTLALPRLSRRAVSDFLQASLPEEVAAQRLDAVYRATEGHPLFLVETTRLLHGLGDDSAAAAGSLGIPSSVKIAIRERLAKLSPETQQLLRRASVFGRDVSHRPLALLLGEPPALVARALAEATERAILMPVSAGSSRFSHMLIQEVLHASLDVAERQALHGELARILAGSGEAPAPWSVLAHHYLQAAPDRLEAGLDAALAAAEEATAQLAFEDAIHWHRTALDALDHATRVEPRRRCALLLGLGRARLLAGEIPAGQRTCRMAYELARALGDGELVAEAALAQASTFVFGDVNDARVRLLEEALQALPEGDSSLRARVQARLAAALQPALDPTAPIELAREAIAMARRLGDAQTLLATLRSACSALMDLGDPEERRALNREHVALAERLGDSVEAQRGNLRLVFDCTELADWPAAERATAAAAELAERLRHPHYRWSVHAIRAMQAAFTGHFAAWRDELAKARELAAQSRDPNARRTLWLHELWAGCLRAEGAALEPLLADVDREFPSGMMRNVGRVFVASARARAGLEPGLAAGEFEDLWQLVARLGDPSIIHELCHVCDALGDARAAQALYDSLQRSPARLVHGGMLEITCKTPKSGSFAQLLRVLGRLDEAERLGRECIAQLAELGAEPYLAWAELELGRTLLLMGPERAREARDHGERAARIATRLDLPHLAERATSLLPGATPAASAPPRAPATFAATPQLALQREGDVWKISTGAQSFRLKHSRGLELLERLVREPGRRFHALDLAVPAEGGCIDLGDAGELLDGRARDAYKIRIHDVQAELDEAERFGDLARRDRARAELEFLQQELSRAVGLGQRERRAGSSSERARVNVQRRLRDAIRRIEREHPALGKHLERSVRTGSFCCYDPG